MRALASARENQTVGRRRRRNHACGRRGSPDRHGIRLALASAMTPTSRPARSPQASLARTARAVGRALPLACRGDGGGPAGPDPSIAGEWSGSAYVGLVDFRATFTESSGVVGGTGHFSSPRGSDDFVVSGTVNGSDVSLVLT